MQRKVFFATCSRVHLFRQIRTIRVILVEGIMRNIYMELFWFWTIETGDVIIKIFMYSSGV